MLSGEHITIKETASSCWQRFVERKEKVEDNSSDPFIEVEIRLNRPTLKP
jgi:hypothetical protein